MNVRSICISASMLFLVVSVIIAVAQTPSAALAALINAERDFAKLSVDKGVREAFTTYFADDGINFQPHPTNTKEAFRKNPAPAAPPPITLNWAPIYGDVSQAGDLGYSTGPYRREDHGPQKQPTRHGMFFSIWKKQPDGSWRVALDLGIQTESPVAPLDAPFSAARQSKSKSSGTREEQLAEINALDQTAFGWASKAKEFLDLADQDLRLYRQRMMPFMGKEAVRAWLLGRTSHDEITVKTIGADVSASGDLGYSYGGYETRRRDVEPSSIEKGYYARIWKRDENGKWRIAFDVTLPLPKEDK